MPKRSERQRIVAALISVEAERDALVVRFAPQRRPALEIEDRIRLAPRGELAALNGIGRWLRILRAARQKAPDEPYEFCADAERAAELLRRCIGVHVALEVARRLERVLTLWTDAGVETIRSVIDFTDEEDWLVIRRRGGGPLRRVPRTSLIRYEASSSERLVVMSVDIPQRA